VIAWSHLAGRAGIAFLGSVAFGAVLLVLPQVSIFVLIPLSVLIYVAVIACFGTVRAQEFMALREPARERKG
jgi:hypothetical protein